MLSTPPSVCSSGSSASTSGSSTSFWALAPSSVIDYGGSPVLAATASASSSNPASSSSSASYYSALDYPLYAPSLHLVSCFIFLRLKRSRFSWSLLQALPIKSPSSGDNVVDHLIQRDATRDLSGKMADPDDDQSWTKYTNFQIL